MDRETLYDLRSLLALYPYYQTARLMLLKNLYILHDASFDEELRKAAVYITDRKAIFNIVEAPHYRLAYTKANLDQQEKGKEKEGESRTVTLIDQFLETVPQVKPEEHPKRKPTAADAAIDYVAYLIESEAEEQKNDGGQMAGQELIDNFINNEGGKFSLKENPELQPATAEEGINADKTPEEAYYTETLARIYIKQGRYSKALEIIKQLNLNNSKKNAYFADQIRFLEKLIINNNFNKK